MRTTDHECLHERPEPLERPGFPFDFRRTLIILFVMLVTHILKTGLANFRKGTNLVIIIIIITTMRRQCQVA